jgi:hypothetical protein
MAIPFENNSSSVAPNSGQNGATSSNSAHNNIDHQNNDIDVTDHPSLPFNNQPLTDAIVLGSDHDGDTVYLGQVIHTDGFYRSKLPAFIVPTKQQIEVSYNGRTIHKDFFIYQKHSNYPMSWSRHRPGQFLDNAFVAGQVETTNGWENIYVGRILINGFLFLGKVTADQKTILISNGQNEVQVSSGFEILFANKGICSEFKDKLCQCCIV